LIKIKAVSKKGPNFNHLNFISLKLSE